MTMFELLRRPGAHFYSPPVDDGGADDELDQQDEETPEEIDAREAQEAAEAEFNARVEARAKEIHADSVERKLAEIQARQTPVQPVDPNEAYQTKLREIAFEEDPVRQEEMRVQLAEERLSQRFQPQLAHSSFEGAVQNVLSNTDVPDNVKPYIAKAVRMYNVTPAQVSTPEGAMQVRRLAAGMAAEDGAYNPAPAPAPRTPNLRPAPVTAIRAPNGGSLANLNENEKKAVNAQWNSLPAAMREGKRIEDIFTPTDIAEICAEVR